MRCQYSIGADAFNTNYGSLFPMTSPQPPVVFTVGHSDRDETEFVRLLTENEIATLVDIRVFPGSRRYPQFNKEALRALLEQADIVYHWAGKQLGGKRPVHPDSPHVALTESGLRGFADYMASDDFQRAVAQLTNLASKARTAIMCAERLPEHCHRSLIADYLILQGCQVIHLIDVDERREHLLRAEARRESAVPIYDRFSSGELDF